MKPSIANGSRAQLSVIYLALAAGVLLYAAVVLFVLDPTGGSIDATTVRWVWLGIAASSTLAIGVVRGRVSGAPTQGGKSSATAPIVVWALAEGQALAGVTGTLISGDRMSAFAGLALFLWLWMRYPPRSFTHG